MLSLIYQHLFWLLLSWQIIGQHPLSNKLHLVQMLLWSWAKMLLLQTNLSSLLFMTSFTLLYLSLLVFLFNPFHCFHTLCNMLNATLTRIQVSLYEEQPCRHCCHPVILPIRKARPLLFHNLSQYFSTSVSLK